MISSIQPKRAIMAVIIGISTLLIMTGCSSGSNASNQKSSKDIQELYQEADKVVKKYMKAHYEYNLPVLFDFTPEKVQKKYLSGEKVFSYFAGVDENGEPTSIVPIKDLITPKKFQKVKKKYNNKNYSENHNDFFKDFSKVKDDLYIVRFDHLFEEKGELAYFVSPWMESGNDPQKGGRYREVSTGHLKLKRNSDGEWKVTQTTSGQFREEGINTSDADEIKAKGTVVQD